MLRHPCVHWALVAIPGWACTAAALGSPASSGPATTQPSGIACYRRTSLEYRAPGKPSLRLEFSEPRTVAVATQPEGWGRHQFPALTRWDDGRVCATWHMAQDSAVAYGSLPGAAVSQDDGHTWTPLTGSWGISGLLLPDGERIVVTTPKSRPLAELRLPEPVGHATATYSKIMRPLYRLSDLPAELQGVHIKRVGKAGTTWTSETARLDDPRALRYSTDGVFPVVWWGDLRVVPDGSVLAGIYPGYRLLDDGTADPKCGVFFYRSTDQGRSWQVQGRIPYQPDLAADPRGDDREGFTEPAFDILPGGLCLCVMRTTDGVGIGPMYASHSTDLGKTWTRPAAITRSGVLPRMLQLTNGVLVLSAGRPGVQLRFCTDGKGETWTDAFEMLAYDGEKDTVSCGYTGLLSTGADRFLVTYSDFKHAAAGGQTRKAIKVREIVATRQ